MLPGTFILSFSKLTTLLILFFFFFSSRKP